MRASAWRGKRGGSDSRPRRAESLIEETAAVGCGDGIFSSLLDDGFGRCGGAAANLDSSSEKSVPCCDAAVLW